MGKYDEFMANRLTNPSFEKAKNQIIAEMNKKICELIAQNITFESYKVDGRVIMRGKCRFEINEDMAVRVKSEK